MSLETVLKNLYRFLEVLQNSRSETVASWDKKSVDNAFKWAEYAEMIFRHSQGKTYAQQLDAEICKLSGILCGLESCKVNLAFLQHSRQYLKHSLLKNSHIRSDLILNLFGVCDDAECHKLAEECMDLVDSERLKRMLISTGDFKDRDCKTQVELFKSQLSTDPALQNDVQSLLEYLGCIDNCSTDATGSRQKMRSSQQKIDHHCRQKEKLTSYTSSSRGFLVSATALVAVSTADEKTIDHRVCDLLLDCVTTTLCRNETALFSLPTFVLIGLCNQHSNILVQYLEYITQCGNSLLPDYDHIYVCHNGVRVSWRSESNLDGLSYAQIKSRIVELLNLGSLLVGVITKKTLEDLSEAVTSKPYIWTDLLEDVECDSKFSHLSKPLLKGLPENP